MNKEYSITSTDVGCYQIDFSQFDRDELMMATIYATQGIWDYLTDFWLEALQ